MHNYINIMWCIFLVDALFGLYNRFRRWYDKNIEGVVIGKFFPLHKGHIHLIKNAVQSKVEYLHIIICYKRIENPSIYLRGNWMIESVKLLMKDLGYKLTAVGAVGLGMYGFTHNESKIEKTIFIHDLEDKDYDRTDFALWAKLTIDKIGSTPNKVFTSEDYGYNYATCIGGGCKHHLIDKERITYPVSGTLVRKNPVKYLSYLPKLVNQYYQKYIGVKRVVIVGPELTGKTSLCKILAKHYSIPFTHEYGRDKTIEKYNKKDFQWTDGDFLDIATKQSEIEDDCKHECLKITHPGAKFIICDTDVLATIVWYKRYMNKSNTNLKTFLKERGVADFYILTDDSAPFVQDGYRDGEHLRNWMYKEFVEVLEENNCEYGIIKGSYKDKESKSIELINRNIYNCEKEPTTNKRSETLPGFYNVNLEDMV